MMKQVELRQLKSHVGRSLSGWVVYVDGLEDSEWPNEEDAKKRAQELLDDTMHPDDP